jgi:dGTPase
MKWRELLGSQRLGRQEPYDTQGRSPFQRDHDRIVFSSAFRRLQDKTQVFPLAHVDYVRTRLTHSLEVSCVGRSLGLAVGNTVMERHGLHTGVASDLGSIVAAACLAHDIGNPPFGHSGEEAIRHWFATHPMGEQVLKELLPEQREEFLNFEGNAQGFRILSRLQHPNNPGGLQLTHATLGAISKYPRPALVHGLDKLPEGVSLKKFSFFEAERKYFSEVARSLGLIEKAPGVWCRHPLAFLVEAADDICYHFIDFGDGFRLGHVEYREVEELLFEVLDSEKDSVLKRMKGFYEEKDRVEYLVGRAISQMIAQVSEVFLEFESSILKAEFDVELITKTPAFFALETIKKLSVTKVYSAREVVEVEAAGYEVLGGLLSLLVPALQDCASPLREVSSRRSRKLLQLVPSQFLGPRGSPSLDPYERLLKITDFISGMTDSYAVAFHSKISGRTLLGTGRMPK